MLSYDGGIGSMVEAAATVLMKRKGSYDGGWRRVAYLYEKGTAQNISRSGDGRAAMVMGR